MENFGAVMLECAIMWLPLIICMITNTNNNFYLVPSLAWASAWSALIVYMSSK